MPLPEWALREIECDQHNIQEALNTIPNGKRRDSFLNKTSKDTSALYKRFKPKKAKQ